MKKREIEIVLLDESSLVENRWNPNRVPDRIFHKLRANIRREGFIDPILVRKMENGRYEILDGAHRVRAGRDDGMKRFPAIVLEDVSDVAARYLTLNMNDIRGTDDPSLLASLLQELTEEFDVPFEELQEYTVYEDDELRRYLDVDEDFRDLDPERKILPNVLAFEFPEEEDFQFARDYFTKASKTQKKPKEQILLGIVKERF